MARATIGRYRTPDASASSGDASLLTDELVAALTEAANDVEVIVGALSASLETEIGEAVPTATTFVSDLGANTFFEKPDDLEGYLALAESIVDYWMGQAELPSDHVPE